MARALVKENKTHQNLIINGNMEVAQRGTSIVSPVSGQYLLDRWGFSRAGVSSTHTVTQDSDVPTFAQSGVYFLSSMRFNLTTPDTTISSGDANGFFQRIEGYNWKKIAQKNFTVSFWVKATLPGTYSVYALNSGEDRTFVADYTISLANTWEKKTVTILASPSAGTWNYTNGIGVTIGWSFAVGSSLQTGTVGSWVTGSFRSSTNQINGVNTGATDFRITGVMVNEGSTAQTYINFARGGIGEELAVCKRYYEFGGHSTSDVGNASGVLGGFGICRYLVEKRATPSLSISGNGSPNQFRNDNNGATEGTATVGSNGVLQHVVRSTAGLSDNVQYSYSWIADAEL